MPRRPRLEGADAIHHVVVQAASGNVIVRDDADRLRFVDELRKVVHGLGWSCIAYSVLDTHAHLVVCTAEPNLSDGMKLILGRYARTFNLRHERHGYLFARPFWSRRLLRPHALRCASLYVVMNPVAGGICNHPRQFRWCSYRETIIPALPGALVTPDLLLLSLDDDRDRARALYGEIVDDAVARLAQRRKEERWFRTVVRETVDA